MQLWEPAEPTRIANSNDFWIGQTDDLDEAIVRKVTARIIHRAAATLPVKHRERDGVGTAMDVIAEQLEGSDVEIQPNAAAKARNAYARVQSKATFAAKQQGLPAPVDESSTEEKTQLGLSLLLGELSSTVINRRESLMWAVLQRAWDTVLLDRTTDVQDSTWTNERWMDSSWAPTAMLLVTAKKLWPKIDPWNDVLELAGVSEEGHLIARPALRAGMRAGKAIASAKTSPST